MEQTPLKRKSPEPEGQESGEKALTEKEMIKRQKEQKRREKEEARLAAEREKKKMGSLLTGWMTKTNNTPSTTTKNKKADNLQSSPLVKNGVHQDPSTRNSVSDFHKTFKPFHLKPNSQLAPINRFRSNPPPPPDSDQPELSHQECLDQFLKLMQLKANNCDASSSSNKARATTIREIVNGIAESELTGCINGSKKWRRALQNRSIVPVKLLRFHEDVRPGYIGTWCKTSRLVSGRNPFGKDTCLLDYEYNSEADWNEDVEGEDLEQSDKEDGGEGSELTDSDEDGWLVGDDDEIEMVDDAQFHASSRAHDLKSDDQLVKSNKKITGLARRRVVGPLIPVIKGPVWEESLGVVASSMLEPYRIQMINDAPLGLNPFIYEPKALLKTNRPKLSSVGFKPSPAILPLPESKNEEIAALKKVTRTLEENSTKENEKTPKANLNMINFPEELIPKMMEFVNGYKKSKPILIEDLKNHLNNNLASTSKKVSKRSIEKVLSVYAVKVAGTWRIIDPSSSASN